MTLAHPHKGPGAHRCEERDLSRQTPENPQALGWVPRGLRGARFPAVTPPPNPGCRAGTRTNKEPLACPGRRGWPLSQGGLQGGLSLPQTRLFRCHKERWVTSFLCAMSSKARFLPPLLDFPVSTRCAFSGTQSPGRGPAPALAGVLSAAPPGFLTLTQQTTEATPPPPAATPFPSKAWASRGPALCFHLPAGSNRKHPSTRLLEPRFPSSKAGLITQQGHAPP